MGYQRQDITRPTLRDYTDAEVPQTEREREESSDRADRWLGMYQAQQDAYYPTAAEL